MLPVARKRCERRRARTRACWLALACCAGACAAQAAVDVRVTPAWDGLVRPGATTEVSVSLRSPRATSVALSARSDGLELVQRVTLDAQAPLVTTLLLRPRGGVARLDIEAQGEPGVTQTIALRVASRAIVAVASSAFSLDQTWADVELLRPATSSLPRQAETYSNLSAIILDGEHLAALDQVQRSALESYAASCGRLVYTGDPARLPPPLRGGCGGRFTRAVSDDAALTATAALLELTPRALPTSAALLTLLDPPPLRTAPIAALLCAYGLLLAWLARSARRPWPLLAAPLLAAALAAATFTAAPPRLDRVLWLETDSGESSARAMLVTAITGRARGREPLPEPAGWQLPEPIDDTPLHIDEAGRVVLETGLLSREVHVARGVLPTPAGLQLTLSETGPRITNAGERMSTPAVLSWRGERHAVPALAPGADWTPDTNSTPWPDAAAEHLLRERSPAEGAALLVPSPATAGSTAWLLVRPAQATT